MANNQIVINMYQHNVQGCLLIMSLVSFIKKWKKFFPLIHQSPRISAACMSLFWLLHKAKLCDLLVHDLINTPQERVLVGGSSIVSGTKSVYPYYIKHQWSNFQLTGKKCQAPLKSWCIISLIHPFRNKFPLGGHSLQHQSF